jgi:hypothetical protein
VQIEENGQYNLLPGLTVVEPWLVATITGRVEPLGIHAEVRAFNAQTHMLVAAASVRADGSYSLPRLPAYSGTGYPIPYRIVAMAPSHLTSEPYDNVTVTAGENTTGFDFTLTAEPTAGGSDYEPWWH